MRYLRLAALSPLAAVLLLSACETAAPPAVPAAPQPSAMHSQLREALRSLHADGLQGRETAGPGGTMARAYFVGRLEPLGVAAPAMGREQPWEMQGRTREGPKTFNGVNVLGVIPGARVTDRYIVVTAHYDHVGVSDGQVFNGADDNASGVATMLALAADLKRQAPDHSVVIVALDGEERGLLGARHFVEAPPVPLTSIAMNLNFDMTARAETDGKLWVTGTYQHPGFRPLLEAIPANGAVALAFGKDSPQDTGDNNWVNSSDHAAFHRARVPFLYFGVDFHPDYHRPSDDFERITPSVFISATELSIAGFRALDRGLDR